MAIFDALKKIPESLQVLPLANNYRKERQQALKALKQKYPDQVQASGLEVSTPFEHPAFLSAMLHLANQIGADILKYHLISDEMSGRIPTSVLLEWQKRVEQQYPEKTTRQPGESEADYILGGERFSNNQRLVEQFVQQNAELFAHRPPLLVTDNIDTGASLYRLLKAFDKAGISLNLAILSHYEPLSEYKELFAGRTVYHGESLPRKLLSDSAGATLIRRANLTGLASPPGNEPSLTAGVRKPEFRNLLLEELVKKQTLDFAQKLPIPSLR